MRNSEYLAKSKVIQETYETGMRNLRNKYALSKNKYKVEDILIGNKDGKQVIIQIKKIKVSYSALWNDLPVCFYEGPVLNDKFEETDNGLIGRVYRGSVSKHIDGFTYAKNEIGRRKPTLKKEETTLK